MIQEIMILLFLYITSFLWHELSHIKSQKLGTGNIFVDKLGMRATSDKTVDYGLFKMSGGILSSIIFFLMVFVSDNFMQWGFLTFGYMQFIYGLFEWKYLGVLPLQSYKFGRYSIYAGVTIMMVILWVI